MPWVHYPLLLSLTASMVTMTTARCMMNDRQCVFHFEIEHTLTMMHHKDLVFPDNGKLYKYDVTNVSTAVPIPADEVITADGWETSRLVAVVNGKMPGPDVIVYEGQKVIVHVKNNLRSHAVTIHWHGLHQPDTPWMDGIPYVTQCPIQPGQTFTYNFIAKPKGTFWWHSHMGGQRSMGVFGAFIIRPRKETRVKDHIMQIMDWNHDSDSDYNHMGMLYAIYEGREKWSNAVSLDGSHYSTFRAHSGLINGMGRYYDPQTGQSNKAPLTVYNVTHGKKYRFRVIGVGSLFPFRISVDNHVITVIASDGYDLEPIVAESFIINPGERFDFEIIADQEPANYWVRGVTVERGTPKRADAILRYADAPDEDPTTERQNCTDLNPCLVLNCPFTFFPEPFTTCRTFDELRSAATDDPAPAYSANKFQEYFLNFAFPGITSYPGSVNGRVFDTPDVNPLTQPAEWYSPCDAPACGEERHCKCTYTLNIGQGDTVQMVFTNMGRGKGWSHPIHMHGHSFYVVKMGYGQYNQTTAEIGADNYDIDCRGHPDRDESFCNDATWTNSSWLDGNVPGMELDRPPRKDTIIVPTGGYVVLRIRADNPGVWIMHCHIELHSLDGMVMLLNESFSEVPPAPEGFPTCHSYPPKIPKPSASDGDGLGLGQLGGDDENDDKGNKMTDDDTVTKETFWLAVGVLAGVVFLQLILLLGICHRMTGGTNVSGAGSGMPGGSKNDLGQQGKTNGAFS